MAHPNHSDDLATLSSFRLDRHRALFRCQAVDTFFFCCCILGLYLHFLPALALLQHAQEQRPAHHENALTGARQRPPGPRAIPHVWLPRLLPRRIYVAFPQERNSICPPSVL
eukprot:scaffold1085_cov407-Prasinococcus_capsulatus_cf.AAC.59